MRIPMTDLTLQYQSLRPEIDSAVLDVLGSGRFILGPEVEAFEREAAQYCGVRFAIGVSSGTDALLLSLMACGVGPGDEVLTTPFTFIATAMAVTRCGARPIFVDIDPRTYNIDPTQLEACYSSATRAVIPVHLFGQAADMDPIMAFAKKHSLHVIEDAAQAMGGEYNGRKLGTIGLAGCFSFFPSKNLGAYGDAGMVVTNDESVAQSIRMMRQHGAKATYFHVLPGFNSRLDALQAAILRIKLRHLDDWTESRRRKFALYNEALADVPGIGCPYIAPYARTSANYYTVRLDTGLIDREALRRNLAEKGIETNVYYPLSLHLQEVYRSLGYQKGDFPQSELAQQQVLSLPMYPELRDEQVNEVAEAIKRFVAVEVAGAR